jgi:hypothetical protein
MIFLNFFYECSLFLSCGILCVVHQIYVLRMCRRVDIFWILRYTARIFACLVRAFPREELQWNLYVESLTYVDVCCLAKNQNISSHKQISIGEMFRHRGFYCVF